MGTPSGFSRVFLTTSTSDPFATHEVLPDATSSLKVGVMGYWVPCKSTGT